MNPWQYITRCDNYDILYEKVCLRNTDGSLHMDASTGIISRLLSRIICFAAKLFPFCQQLHSIFRHSPAKALATYCN